MTIAKDYASLPVEIRARWATHSQALLNSHRLLSGEELLERSHDPQDEAERLFLAPFVVVSHGVEADPILNYGNKLALELWELDVATLLATPSRLTAEPALRAAREHALAETQMRGFVTGYEGIRVSATGRRFRILDTTIWNVTGLSGEALGQAAKFARWAGLNDKA